MMKNKKALFIFIGLAVITLAVFLYYFNSNKNRYDWTLRFDQKGKQPYSTFVISGLLESYFPQKKFISLNEQLSQSLNTDSTQPGSYVFIGHHLFLNDKSTDSLLAFVENGHTAFISAHHIAPYLASMLELDVCDESYEDEEFYVKDSLVKLNFAHPQLHRNEDYTFVFEPQQQAMLNNWFYFDTMKLCGVTSSVALLGKMQDGHANFVRINHGKGQFYFHTTPLVFTNYYLLEKEALEYSNKVFSHLPEGNIYWDEFSKVPMYEYERPNVQMGKGPLYFILSQPALRWAWYLLLSLALLYILFNAKRKQRIVPVAEPNINTSLEFIETIGGMYYRQHNHQQLSAMKMRHFLEFIRNRYHLPTNVLNDELVAKISRKSEIPQQDVQSIFRQYKTIHQTTEIPVQWLIGFHNDIENFIKNCK